MYFLRDDSPKCFWLGHGRRFISFVSVSILTWSKPYFQRKPLYHFITTVLAIIGGTFTVAGMIDSMVSGDKQYKIFIINVMNFEGYNDS